MVYFFLGWKDGSLFFFSTCYVGSASFVGWSFAHLFGIFNGFGILPVFQGFCERVVEGKELKSWGRTRGLVGCWWVGLWGVPGRFSTSGIYEALRYAVMQKGILKLTKRPLVQVIYFFQEPVALYLGQYSEEPQTVLLFMRHYFFLWGLKPGSQFFFFKYLCVWIRSRSVKLLFLQCQQKNK